MDDKDGAFPLLMAAQQGHEGVVRDLLQAKAEINKKNDKNATFPLLMDGTFPLLMAAHQGHEGVVRDLLQAKAEISTSN